MVVKAGNLNPPQKGIAASVGRKGRNGERDVYAVQKLLNAAGAGVKEDGDCGRATINAIEDFQRNWTRHPDGRVDPGGHTWKKLTEGKLKIVREGFILLPQYCGNGYYSYSAVERQYGTTATVFSLIRVCREFAQKHPTLQIGIGDLSLVKGAKMTPHKTHRNGRNADLRPLRKDGKMLPVTISSPQYSREYTRELVALLRSKGNVKSILFNDAAIAGVTRWEGHDNHLHVSMKE